MTGGWRARDEKKKGRLSREGGRGARAILGDPASAGTSSRNSLHSAAASRSPCLMQPRRNRRTDGLLWSHALPFCGPSLARVALFSHCSYMRIRGRMPHHPTVKALI